MVFASLLTTVLLTLAVAAEPILLKRPLVSLPVSRRINVNSSVRNILEHDQTRSKALKAHGQAKAAGITSQINLPATNKAVSYVASIGVGEPATPYSLIIYTGSSNTWVGANPDKPYKKTSTSVKTGQSMTVLYGLGSFYGKYSLSYPIRFEIIESRKHRRRVPRQSYNCFKPCHCQAIDRCCFNVGFSGVDGIMGLGPVNLTVGTLIPDIASEVPTVTHTLSSEGKISKNLIGVSFEPLTKDPETNGVLTWGGIDNSLFTGSITYTPVTTTSPASKFWGINESIMYGTHTILATTAGIVDTRTTLVLIASNAFRRYKKLTGAVDDEATGLLRVNSTQFANLKTLNFVIAGTTFGLTANAQIWPRALNADIGGVTGNIYLIVGNLATPSGQGFDFINGQTFLERFYAVFDTANNLVGIATTSFTNATTN